jgi:hypothetical protein
LERGLIAHTIFELRRGGEVPMPVSTIRAGLLACLVAASAGRAQPPSADVAGADARGLAGKVLEALGGEQAWNQTHYLRFDFAVEAEGKEVVRRAHTWDKWTGRYRLEAKTREGKPFLVLMNVNTRQGTALLDGKPATGDELKQLLERGYGIWVNDTYWLLMPYKMLDPGVNLAMDGEQKSAEGAWDKVRLSFDNVGLTPKDRYWAYVNRSTRLVDRWDYILQDDKPDAPATSWDWKGWRRYGKILLAPDRVNEKDKRRIYFPVLEVPDAIPDAAFTAP